MRQPLSVLFFPVLLICGILKTMPGKSFQTILGGAAVGVAFEGEQTTVANRIQARQRFASFPQNGRPCGSNLWRTPFSYKNWQLKG
jgi:hypothetical protein